MSFLDIETNVFDIPEKILEWISIVKDIKKREWGIPKDHYEFNKTSLCPPNFNISFVSVGSLVI